MVACWPLFFAWEGFKTALARNQRGDSSLGRMQITAPGTVAGLEPAGWSGGRDVTVINETFYETESIVDSHVGDFVVACTVR
jgi:hypothetical protein